MSRFPESVNNKEVFPHPLGPNHWVILQTWISQVGWSKLGQSSHISSFKWYYLLGFTVPLTPLMMLIWASIVKPFIPFKFIDTDLKILKTLKGKKSIPLHLLLLLLLLVLGRIVFWVDWIQKLIFGPYIMHI